MPLYILEIPGSEFTGVRGGIDFFKGRGSTSSKADALRMVERAGCQIVVPEPASETKTEGGPAGPPSAISPAPVPEPQEVLEPRIYANKKEREANERVARKRGAKIK